jgi:hypothetical protein
MEMTEDTTHDEEIYLGFYLIEEFWADVKPDYSKFGSYYWLIAEFWELMEELVVVIEDGERKICISRDGMIMYSDPRLANRPEFSDETYQRLDQYAQILNALRFVFVAKTRELTRHIRFQYFEITHNDIIPISYKDGQRSSMGIPQKSMQLTQVEKRQLNNVPMGYLDNLDGYIDPHSRIVLPKELLTDIANIFLEATADATNTRLLARSNKASSEFEGASFSDSIIIAWTEIEIYLYDMLRESMSKEGSERFNRDRRDFLENEFSASEVIELLEAIGAIGIDEYKDLNTVRKKRNKIIHDGVSSTFQQGVDALLVLEKVITAEQISPSKSFLPFQCPCFRARVSR